MSHVSVLYDELINAIDPREGGYYIDGTLGYGGHSEGILQRSAPNGRLLAFDRDITAISLASERLAPFGDRVTIVQSSFEEMGTVAPAYGFGQVDGIALDLGLSSMQLDTPERGFSFRFSAPLDMRFDQNGETTAADLLNDLPEQTLCELFWRYGEMENGRRIAQAVVQNRPITTTTQLADLMMKITPRHLQKRIHPATQLFQALRIAVNDELGALERVLPAAIQRLKPKGRLAVISFHSLEDRIVKQLFRDLSRDCICPAKQPICTCGGQQAIVDLYTRKAIQPSEEEIKRNPRSRSARLRVVEKR